ncbi:MAG TPA: peptidoglycan DD-metalloendopeptidase family protein [Actinomycetota bacterium]
MPARAVDSRLEQTRREIAAAKARLTSIVQDDEAVLSVLASITARLNAEQADLAAARERLTRVRVLIATEEHTLAALRRKTEMRQRVIEQRARALYMGNPTQVSSVSYGVTSLDDYVDKAGFLGYVASFDQRVLEDIQRYKDEARRTMAALAVQRREASAQAAVIRERVQSVRELVAVQRAAHAKLSTQAQGFRNEIAALQAEQRRIESIIYSRSGSVNTGGSGAHGFAWPIRGPITSPYGPRWGGFHTGIDIDCSTGDGIGASKAGRVIAAEYGGGYGNMVIIDHGGGYTTLYAHMSRFYVGRGASVGQHTRIGACGATGNATGDHLHFEVRVNTQHRNPMDYLP